MTHNTIALAVETWNREDGVWERLRLKVDPQQLAILAASSNPSPVEVNTLMDILIWQISLKWLYKLKLNSGYRLKGPRCLINPIKPFGVILCSALNITEQLCAYKIYQPNLTALEAFAPLAIELFSLCYALPEGGKEAKVKELRLIVKALRDNQQPFDQRHLPTLFNWWETIRPIVSNPNYRNFSGKYLFRAKTIPAELGLNPALTGWIQALHQNGPLVAVKADLKHLLFQEDRGRPIRVKPELVKNFFISEILSQ